MVAQRNFRYRIYLSKKQEVKLNKQISDCCFVYNKLLETKINAYKENKTNRSQFDLNKIMKDIDVPVHSKIKQNISKGINDSFNQFFRRVKEKKGKIGFPRFKSFNRCKSITFPQSGFKVDLRKLYISKIGNVPIVLHREIKGKIKTLTIKRCVDKWYVILACEGVVIDKIKPKDERVGIDVGIETFATLSNGEIIENPKFFRKNEKQLAGLQRRLSRKKKGSKNKGKARLKVVKQHEKIFNQRNDFLHNQTAKIVRRFKVIAVEKLNIKGMVKNRYLTKSISDASWNRFIETLSYKVANTGGKVELINPKYTSQIYSSCGHKQKRPLSKRTYECEECGLEINRDLNASKNILVGLDKSKLNSFGDTVRPSVRKVSVVELGTILREDAQP